MIIDAVLVVSWHVTLAHSDVQATHTIRPQAGADAELGAADGLATHMAIARSLTLECGC